MISSLKASGTMTDEYERLTCKCRSLYRELEGLTHLQSIMGPTDAIQCRRAVVLELIDGLLDIESMYWPSVPHLEKQRVLSDLVKDYLAHPDLSIGEIGRRNGITATTAGYRITQELKSPVREWIIK